MRESFLQIQIMTMILKKLILVLRVLPVPILQNATKKQKFNYIKEIALKLYMPRLEMSMRLFISQDTMKKLYVRNLKVKIVNFSVKTKEEPVVNMVDCTVSVLEPIANKDDCPGSVHDLAVSVVDCPGSVLEDVKLDETHQSETANVVENTEQSTEVALINKEVLVDVASEANDSSDTSKKSEKDHDSTCSGPRTTISPKVKPASEKKIISSSSTLKTQANVSRFQKHSSNEASKGPMKPRTNERSDASKGPMKPKTNERSEASKGPMKPRTNERSEASKGPMKPRTSEWKILPSSEASKGLIRPSEASKGLIRPRTSEGRYMLSSDASKGTIKPRTSEIKNLPLKQTEKKLPRPASPFFPWVKSSKTEFAARCVDIIHHPAVLHGENMEVLPEGEMGTMSEGQPRT